MSLPRVSTASVGGTSPPFRGYSSPGYAVPRLSLRVPDASSRSSLHSGPLGAPCALNKCVRPGGGSYSVASLISNDSGWAY